MNYVLTLTKTQADHIMMYYQKIQETTPVSPIRMRVKQDSLTVTLYHTNRVMFQGATAETTYLYWVKMFDLIADVKKTTTYDDDYFMSSIGSDESGVGDYFGPLTVCAAYIDNTHIPLLKKLGVKDSKQLSDLRILSIAPKLIKEIPYSLLVLKNPQYNQLITQGFNANKLKAHMHAQAQAHLIKKLGKKPLIVLDQFCDPAHYKRYLNDFKHPPKVDRFKTKAESFYASVATASIIARYSFINQLKALGDDIGEPLKKGASAEVDAQAASLLERFGKDTLHELAKSHFKTTEKATSLLKSGLELRNHIDTEEDN